MIISLLKKDYLMIRKYVWIMFLAAIAIPPVMRLRTPEFTGAFGFILSVIFSVFMLLQYISLKEYQFSKATAFLCAAPFTREQMVLSRYLFCVTVYGSCCVIFKIETLLFSWLGTADMALFVVMFFITAIFISIYLPLQYQFGYEKTRVILAAVILASPVLLPVLIRITAATRNRSFSFSRLILCMAEYLCLVL